jgi:hypothetical protein
MNSAAALPKSRYPIDMSKGAETLLPHLVPVKQLAQLSKWAAIQRAKDGKTEEATQILKNGFALTATLETEPIMISELIRIASVTLLVQGMEQALFESDFTEAQLRQLAEMVGGVETRGTNSMLRVIAGERAFGLAHMEASFKQFSQSWGSGSPNFNSFEDVAKVGLFGSRKLLGLHARDQAFFLETMEAWERAAQLDYPEMWRESERAFKEAEGRMQAHPIRYLISRLILPAMDGFTKKGVYLEARLRCARAALAIQLYRSRHEGKLPNLGELVPEFLTEIPRDPADNQPLEYRTAEDKGYKIIAVTSTEMMNEGRKPTNRVDVGFTVKR